MAIYTTELLTDRDYNIPEGRLPLEYAVDQSNKAKTHSENANVHVTADEKAVLNLFTSSEGRNLVIAANGTVATQIGHSYVVTAKTTNVAVTDTTSGDPLATVPAGTQLGFTATSASATLSSTNCTVTEVFRGAALVELSGSGYPEPPYVAFNANRSEITAADLTGLTDGSHMFYSASRLISFNSDLSSLTNGDNMFYGCSSLTSFNSDLSSLTNGEYMFCSCSSLTSFSIDLPALTAGDRMFYGCKYLTSFSIDLPALTTGGYMFHSCYELTSFSSDLSSLTAGGYMFYNCKVLTSFSSDLPSLTTGGRMFDDCKLDKASALRVLNTIPTYTSGSHSLTLGMAAALQGDADIAAALTAASAKGWTVTAQYN